MDLQDILATGGFATYALRHPLEGLSSFGPTLSEATFGLLGASFKPERDISDIEGKTILVTGGKISTAAIIALRVSLANHLGG